MRSKQVNEWSKVLWAFPVAQMIKNLSVLWETQVQSMRWKDPLEKRVAAHSSILIWKIPWTEEPGKLQVTGLQSKTQLSHTHTHTYTHTHTELYLVIVSIIGLCTLRWVSNMALNSLKGCQWISDFPDGSVRNEYTCNAGNPDSIPGSGRSSGEGIGYPLQYSGIENSMDCTVHGVAKSPTWQSDFRFQLI